eukprot:5208083-Amphidinium_carterae.1
MGRGASAELDEGGRHLLDPRFGEDLSGSAYHAAGLFQMDALHHFTMKAIATTPCMSSTFRSFLMSSACHGLIGKYHNEEAASFNDTEVEDSHDDAMINVNQCCFRSISGMTITIRDSTVTISRGSCLNPRPIFPVCG